MAVLKCKMCAGNIIPVEGKNLGVCDSCGSTVTLPSITDERRTDTFNRGNHFRQVYEFDAALKEYSQIVREDPEDAEAHWCMTLCRYGINYHQDHRTGQRIPTCDRVSYTSILEDPDYLAALKYADGDQKALYQAEAKRIYKIQQGILEVSAKEKPFDVFICFKDTDDKTGKRTRDSVLAQDLYSELTKRDYKVFFSRITLKEEHMGQEWEPYIFAALNSAKVMLVVGTTPENFSSPWVKNEWSRFLNLRRMDKTKILIPCVSGMSPNALPAGLKELEGRDMSEISFMQDILYGIERVIRGDQKKTQSGGGTVSAANYVKRAFMALEDREFAAADKQLEQALNLDPENGQAHLGKLLVERKCTCVEELAEEDTPLSGSGHYNRAVKFGDLGTQQKLRAAESQIQERVRQRKLSETYQRLCNELDDVEDSEKAERLAKEFDALGDYRHASQKAAEAREAAESIRQEKAEQQRRLDLQRRQQAEEKAKAEAAEKAAAEKAANRVKRKRRSKRIRRLIFVLIILGIILNNAYTHYLEAPRAVYDEAEAAMEQGDYETAAVDYFEVANTRLADTFFKDAEQKGIEACTAWLGWEPVVLSTSDCPWFSVDSYGHLEFNSSRYDSSQDFVLPTILDGQLVTGLSSYCFEGDGVVSLTLPDNYTYIGERAFSSCQTMNSIVLGQNTAYIGDRAFNDCDSLTSVTIPGSVSEMGDGVFYDCDYLNSVTLMPGVQEIGSEAFYECDGLTSIYIPSSVTRIGSNAFSSSGIMTVTMEEGVSGIESGAFYYCQNLTEVTIPGSCTEIGAEAFRDCDALTSVTLNSGVEVVGEKAFQGCEQLSYLALSDTLTTIGSQAFAYDSALGSISLPATLNILGDEAFTDCDSIGEVWIADNNGLTVGVRAFYGCDALTGAYVGYGTTSLEDSAFAYCEAMNWVTLPEGLTNIGASCFSDTALREINLPSTVTTIGESAFYDCDQLTGVTIPAGVSIIESRTFSYCSSLYWIWFGDGLSIIRDDAFYGSDNLSQVYFSGSADTWYAVSKGDNDALNNATLISDYYG